MAPQFVQAHPDGRSIEPGFGVFKLRLRVAGKFQKDFDGDFLGAGMVANHTDNDAGNARVLGPKQGFEIKIDSVRWKIDCKFRRRGL